jgi:DNA-binding transcriptional LysR family regulator
VIDMATLRDLEIRHLVALDAVATEGTFGRAAERLGYTQSAISQQIASLERLVDGKVFDRPGGPRPVELTPLGSRLLDAARELLARVDAIAEDLDRFRTGEVGRITVGSFQSVSATVLPLVVGRLRAEHPEVEIRVFESDADGELEQALGRGELDVSFIVGDWPDQYEQLHLLDDPFVVLTRPGQFAPGVLSLAQIADEPMVGQHHNSCQLMNEAGLRAAGLEPNYVFRSNDNGTVAAMVRAGMGVAVQPLLCVDPDDPRVELHPIDPPMPDRSVSIAWRADRTRSPVAARFVELAAEVSRQFAGRALPIPV